MFGTFSSCIEKSQVRVGNSLFIKSYSGLITKEVNMRGDLKRKTASFSGRHRFDNSKEA